MKRIAKPTNIMLIPCIGMASARFRSVAVFLLLILTTFLADPAHAAETPAFRDIRMTPERNRQDESRGLMRTDAQEVTDILQVHALVEKIRSVKSQNPGDSSNLAKPLQQARLLTLWKLLQAEQEVRKAVALIDFELATSNASLDDLTAKKNMTINMINTVNFMQGGTLGVIRQSMALHGVYPIARQDIAITSFGTGTALSIVNLLVDPFFSRRIDAAPNSLAHFFDNSYEPSDLTQSFLWKFLDSPIPGSKYPLKRREILVRHWHDFAGINAADSLALRKLGSNPNQEENISENIRSLNSRITLLQDLKTHIEEFEGALFEVHQAITFNDSAMEKLR